MQQACCSTSNTAAMKIHYKKVLYLFSYCAIAALPCCKKFVQLEAPPDLIETNQVFSNDKAAVSSAAGLYIQMRNQSLSITNGGLSVYAGLSADDIINTSSSTTADAFSKNALLPTTPAISSNFWSSSYRNIYQTNAILEGLSRSTSLTDSVKRQLQGEMKVVRAFYYFYLTQLFGDIPLVETTDYQVNDDMPRTPANIVINQMIEDLKEAENILSAAYPSSGRARPNKWTASTLLARFYLLKKDWSNAETEASAVINSAMYSLTSSLNNVFVGNSNETIWQIIRDLSNTAEGMAFIPSSTSAKPAYTLTTNLINSFEAGDQRRTNWVKSNTVGGALYYYPYKYKVRVASPVSEYEIVFRLAELYLLRAEARAEQHRLQEARDDLNMVRVRAGLPLVTTNDQTLLLSAIYHERQTELFCEWGHRWLDLKRWNLADVVLLPLKGTNWQGTDVLYPIPQGEIDKNPALRQNDGY